MTIGRVLAQGKDEGSGFVIATGPGRSSRVVLTAAHVVGGHSAASLEFRSGDRVIAVERAESDEDLDVAVLHLAEEVDGLVAARPRERLAWQVDARPRANDARLTGIVSDPERPFSKKNGPDIHVVQLLVDQVLGDYKGYSGSPVVLGSSDSRPALGVLIEQLRWRTQSGPGRGKEPAGNVLYAVSIADALARFGLDTVWVPAGGERPDEELVARYLEALAARFRERYGPRPHVALGLERGSRAPVPVPAALFHEDAEMLALLGPRLVPDPPEPGSDHGQPIDDLGAFQASHVRVVLLGRPGAGKSSTLRRLVTGLGDTRVPIFADLSEWHDPSADLLAFLQAQLRSLEQRALADRLPGLMGGGRVVLLLDGLNEIPRLGRDPATGRLDDPRVRAVAELGTRAEWATVGCVLSCRPRDFDGGPAWHDLHLLDLDGGQAEAFAEAYFRDLPDAEALTRGFVREIGPYARGRAGRLRDLTESPFFLVRSLAYYRRTRTLSGGSTDLLRVTVAGALNRERVGDRAEELQRRLGCLAFRMTANGQFGPVDRESAAAWLEPEEGDPVGAATAAFVWRTAEGADLLIASDHEVRFSHQLYQEYFTARFLRARPVTAALVATVAQPQFNEIWSVWSELDPALVDRLIPVLADPTADARRAAATILGRLGNDRAADPLAGALADADATVGWSAALGLALLGDRRATPVLAERLRDGESASRQAAAQALGGLGDPAAVDPLIGALGDESAEVRVAAATALGGSGDGRALRPLVEKLVGSRDGELSRAAARALGRLRDPRAVPDLIAQLGDSAARPGAVDGLLAMGETALDPLIEVLLHDRNAERRGGAVFVLGLSHRPRAVPALAAALNDDDNAVREKGATALGYFGEPALASLIGVLRSGTDDARRWALYALGLMRDPRAVPHLIAALEGESEEAAEQAARSLRLCGDCAVEPLTEILLDHVDPQTSWNAATALSGLGEPGITALVTSASSDDPTVRRCAVAGLGEAANRLFLFEPLDPRVAGTLADAIHDIDPMVGRIATLALGQAGDARAVPSLQEMVRSDEPDFRAAALEQLGRVEDPSAVDALVTALRHTDAETRVAACEALRRLLDSPQSVADTAGAAIEGAGTDARTALIDLLTAWRSPELAPALLPALRRAMAPLLEVLRDPDSRVAFAAVGALARAARPLTTPDRLLPDDEDEATEHEAARLGSLVRETLVPLPAPEAVPALLATLDRLDDESDDAWAALRAPIVTLLGSLGDRRAVPAVIGLLRSSDHDLMEAASQALARLGDPEAVPAIIDAMTRADRSGSLRTFVFMEHVLILADDRTPGLLLAALRGADRWIAGYTVELLQELGELALVPLVAALADPDTGVARGAARALDPAEQNFLWFLPSDDRRRPAVEALDRLSDHDVETLVAVTRHQDRDVARVAVVLLERLGHPAAHAAEPPPPQPPERGVEDLTSADAEQARGGAAHALGQLGDRSVIDRLAPLLDDPSRLVVIRAARALGRLGGADAVRLLLGALNSDSARGPAADALRGADEQTCRDIGVAPVVGALLGSIRRERRFQGDYDDHAVYSAARELLPRLGEPVRTLLLAALDDSHDAVRHLAAEVLAEGSDLRALLALAWMEEHDRGEYVSGGSKPGDAARTARDRIQSAHPARERLIEALTSDDRLTRFGAAFQLAHREWRGVTPTLNEALRDDDHRVRWGAARWLGVLRDERGIGPLAATLGDPVEAVRESATRSLISFGPAAMPSVVAALDAPNADARAKAALILGCSGGADDVARLTGALGDPATSVSTAAATSLAQLADREMTEEADVAGISAALKDAFAAVEQQAHGGFAQWPIMDALERFDRDGLVEVLIEALGSSRRDARTAAAKRLGRLGDRRAVAPLNQAVSDEEWTVREDAADSLRQFADPSSVEPLIGMLSRDAGLSCLAAIETLAAIADPRAAAPMVAQLRSEIDSVRAAAEDTIVALADDAAIASLVALLGEDPPDWFGYSRTETDPPGLRALTRIGARAVRPLTELAAGPDEVPGRRAAEALRGIGAEAVPALLEGLAGFDDGPAQKCAEILAELGEPGVSAFATAITDERPEVRAGAAYGLWLACEESTISLLVAALSDTEADVRCYAALALSGFRQTSLIEPVAALAADPDGEVRVCAATTLARLGDDRGTHLFRAALAGDGEAARLAARLIGVFEVRAGVEPLIEALRNESAELRRACAVALGEVGDPRALPALDRAAEDPTAPADGTTVGAAAAEAARKIRACAGPPPEDHHHRADDLPQRTDDGGIA